MMKPEKFQRFSVPLGLLDYGNPLFYGGTMAVVLTRLYGVLEAPYYWLLFAGAVLSLLGGLAIPTGKVLVGLGVMKFKMPVGLVFAVNAGIFLTGLMLVEYAFSCPWHALLIVLLAVALLLFLLFLKTKKANTVAVLTGAAGYCMTYVSLIAASAQRSRVWPIVLFACAILLFLMLCFIGVKGDLKNPKVHWIIEISNVLCQALVFAGACLLLL